MRYLPATVTAGSGGSAGTVNKTNPADAAASATARINDTTQAISSGTIVDLWADDWNIINGFLWVPPVPSRPFVIPPAGQFVLSLDSAPASIVASGTVWFEEI